VEQDPRWLRLVFLIHWLLRLRTAQTCFFKVPAHKGFKQNENADALAQKATISGPNLDVPVLCSAFDAFRLLLRYLIQQETIDGGVGGLICSQKEAASGKKRVIRRPKPRSCDDSLTEIVALDCEMVGVGRGGHESKLASVCIVNAWGNQVYFSYCLPALPVTDYRTRVSGITPHLLVGAPCHEQVQREVAKLLYERIVVGHDLQWDFKALGFRHPRASWRDTARDLPRFFNRRSGGPRKLRELAWEFLGLTIQDGPHSPCEDARASLELYFRFKRQFEEQALAYANSCAQPKETTTVG